MGHISWVNCSYAGREQGKRVFPLTTAKFRLTRNTRRRRGSVAPWGCLRGNTHQTYPRRYRDRRPLVRPSLTTAAACDAPWGCLKRNKHQIYPRRFASPRAARSLRHSRQLGDSYTTLRYILCGKANLHRYAALHHPFAESATSAQECFRSALFDLRTSFLAQI